jgi:glycosyltransferase involved in cell wall biosynthesis
MNPCTVTIIICTCNRADNLAKTLDAIGRLEVPRDLLAELLVVDNASSDSTHDVVRRCTLGNMRVRYLHEPRRGKCNALNTSLAQSGGEIILFTDDDVRPPVGWIEALCRPIAADQADIVKGHVVMSPENRRICDGAANLHWLRDAESDDRGEPVASGSNMAVARRVLGAISGFDPELGPGALGFHDDVLFWEQLVAAGARPCVARGPDSVVEHHFDPRRLERAAMKREAASSGRSIAYFDYHWAHSAPADPTWRILRSYAGLWWARARNPFRCWSSKGIPPAERYQYFKLGYLLQLKREMRRPRNYRLRGVCKIHGTLPQPFPEGAACYPTEPGNGL